MDIHQEYHVKICRVPSRVVNDLLETLQLAKREAKEEALRLAELEEENAQLDDWKMSLGKSLPGQSEVPENTRDINEASEKETVSLTNYYMDG